MELADRSLQFDARRDSMVDLDGGPEKETLGAGLSLSDEESRIRSELELDVERDLEQEIKNGIYRLALQLHRLYQHKQERVSGAPHSMRSAAKNRLRNEEKSVSEVNLSIKMEGGTKVEIRETKRDVRRDKPQACVALATPNSNPHTNNHNQRTLVRRGKRFDWAKSLRSGGGANVAVGEKGSRHDSGKSRTHSCDRRGSCSSLRSEGYKSGINRDQVRHKVNRRVDHKLLDMEMGWKS